MELNKKVDQLLQELKSRKFNKVIFMDWSYDPDDILKYFNFYFEHMRFWKKKCEDFIYDINYEDIVNNSEHEIRKLLNYCELG
jgi:hypothetical protein